MEVGNELMREVMTEVNKLIQERLPEKTYFCLTAVTGDEDPVVNFISTMTHDSTLRVLKAQVSHMEKNPQDSEKIFLK